MATNYYVRVICRTESVPGEVVYKRTIQTVLDPAWIPPGCEGHELSDFTIEEKEEV